MFDVNKTVKEQMFTHDLKHAFELLLVEILGCCCSEFCASKDKENTGMRTR